MSYIDPDLLHGELDNFITFVGNNTAALTTAGFNATTVQTNLTTIKTDLSGKKTTRDNQKTVLALAQQAFGTSATTNYAAFSNAIDAVAGALGKQTPAGKQVLNYRKHVTGSDAHASPTPVPATVPAK